ncbi:MAG: Hypothetical nudix hydrolase YeaB [uncultured Chloroflexia bacterium]|uniref:Hypothetical nudix hydrolase YeaB n=1 Tax=uncultured Chloroflexia bacterium TaxID=1672391 RepID=A0A6J4I8I6_9CHLR|nr:MAG: Hypothetical nudix hydrolase YeaB [uncultured Chloroflexia bacterium]
MASDATWDELKTRVQHASGDALGARERLMPRDDEGRAARPLDAPPGAAPRLGAVLLLVYPYRDEPHLPLTVRTASLRNHSGEVSLPGGGFDPADGVLEQTALREAWEELGVPPRHVDIVATLSPVWIPVSNFRITPFVGFIPERPPFSLAAGEVAELLETPLSAFRQPDVLQNELREVRGRHVHVPYFAIDGHKVWGATALVLAEFVARAYGHDRKP